jgi:hypothetical protein
MERQARGRLKRVLSSAAFEISEKDATIIVAVSK